MLYITYTNRDQEEIKHVWHVGQEFPQPTGRVVTFQADGDELDFILERLNPKPTKTVDVDLGVMFPPKWFEGK